MSRGRRYQAVYATDDTLSPGRAVEHTTAEFASSGSATRTHPNSGTSLAAGAPQFDALFRAHYRRICRVIYRIVGQPDLAEELAAEAFWKLHQRRPAHLTNAEAWLCRTGVRLALDSLRKGRRRARYESAAPPAQAPDNPEDDLARTQEQERVRQVLAAMKPDHAALLTLRAEGLSYQELAAALRLNPASVGTMLARAESKFRQEYEKRHGDEHGRR
jgi:RNA polymerase sigma-70 factor (ECF subfamily)